MKARGPFLQHQATKKIRKMYRKMCQSILLWIFKDYFTTL